MNSSGVKALPARGRWRKLCLCAAAFSLGASLHSAPSKAAHARSQQSQCSQESDLLRPDPGPPPQDLLLGEGDERQAEALASYARGILAETNAEADEALEAYRKVLDLDPGFGDLAAKVALELVRRKSFDQAINLLKDALKARPKNAALALLAAQIYGKYLGKPDLAARYASMALEIDPSNEVAFLTLFESQAALPKKAEQLIQRAARNPNPSPRFWLQLAEIYHQVLLNPPNPPKPPKALSPPKPAGEGEAGETGEESSGSSKQLKPEDLHKVNALYQRALDLARKNSSGSEEAPAVLLKIADFYVASSQYAAAIPLYEQLIQGMESNPDAVLPFIQQKLARAYRMADRVEDAIRSLKEIIRQNPLQYESYELLADICEQSGDLENALLHYQQLLLLKPGLPVNYLRVADLFLKTSAAAPERIAKAIETLKEAREKFPEVPQIGYSLALAQSRGGFHQEALTTFSQSYNEAKAGAPEMLNGTFYLAYGAAAEQAGHLEEAEVMLRRAIEVEPENAAQPCNYLGYMWVDRGLHLEEAGKLIERALELEPSNGAFLDSLGWFHYQKGEYAKALEALKKAADLIKPADVVVLEHLGDTFLKLGNPGEARNNWGKALELETRHPSAPGVPGSPAGTVIQRLKEKLSHGS